jgi:hypothetical protein
MSAPVITEPFFIGISGSIEDKAMAKELMLMRSELETVLIEQVGYDSDYKS